MRHLSSSPFHASHPYSLLKPKDESSGWFNAVIESPRGIRNKYKLNEDRGYFELHKVLPVGMLFPLDFGFIPGTRADDGDPLDVLVFMDEPTFTGCVLKVRLIGAITAEQRSKEVEHWTRNDRLLAVSVVAHRHGNLKSIIDVETDWIRELEHFFVSYNSIQGKEFRIIQQVDRDAASMLVQNAALKPQGTIG